MIALMDLCITNSPGSIPSTLRLVKGSRFQLEGNEPVDVVRLIKVHAMEVYTGSDQQESLVKQAGTEAEKVRNNPFTRKKRERAANG